MKHLDWRIAPQERSLEPPDDDERSFEGRMDEEIAREEEGEPIDFGDSDFDIDPDMGDHYGAKMNKRAEDLALAISKIAEAYDPTFGLPIYPEVVPNHAEPRRQILALIDAELLTERQRCAERAVAHVEGRCYCGMTIGEADELSAAILKEEP